jgi:hypothetical protein
MVALFVRQAGGFSLAQVIFHCAISLAGFDVPGGLRLIVCACQGTKTTTGNLAAETTEAAAKKSKMPATKFKGHCTL